MAKNKIRVIGFLIAAVCSGLGNVSADEVQKALANKVGLVTITVYRSPTCSCCGQWVEHLKANAFDVKDIITNEIDQVKDRLGVPPELASCHTAVVGDYFIEGHVPAGDIARLISLKPAVRGVAVPGMPRGTPGMEVGTVKDDFDVYAVEGKRVKIFNQYRN